MSETAATLDRSVLDRLGDELGEPAVLARLVGLYLDRLGPRRDALLEAVAAGDAAELRASAHSLKSASATFGAMRVAELATQLEALGDAGDVPAARPLADELSAEADRAHAALSAAVGL